jgi:hypothetical protein
VSSQIGTGTKQTDSDSSENDSRSAPALSAAAPPSTAVSVANAGSTLSPVHLSRVPVVSEATRT